MLYDKDNDIPTNARILINQSLTRYNNNLCKMSSYEKSFGVLLASTAPTAAIGLSIELQPLVTGALCLCCFILLYLVSYLYPYLDSPVTILDCPMHAAFFASFHGEKERDLALLNEDSDLWQKMCHKYRQKKTKNDELNLPNTGLSRAMAIDCIAVLFHIKNY